MYREELRRLGAIRTRALAEVEDVGEAMRPFIVEALRDGMRPGEVVKLTGYSPAQVRVIARVAGLEPARRGKAA